MVVLDYDRTGDGVLVINLQENLATEDDITALQLALSSRFAQGESMFLINLAAVARGADWRRVVEVCAAARAKALERGGDLKLLGAPSEVVEFLIVRPPEAVDVPTFPLDARAAAVESFMHH